MRTPRTRPRVDAPAGPSTAGWRPRGGSDAADARPATAAEPLSLLLSLNDDLLLAIIARLAPYPHGFLLGRTCKRLHALVSSVSLRLIVSPAATGAGAPGTARAPRPPCRAAFATLAAAVAASRPGDTIEIECGLTHACADVALLWPVRLVGGLFGPGAATEGTPPPPPPTLAPAGAAATVLDVSASALLHGLHIVAPRAGGPCVWHRAGALRIACCSVQGVAPRPGSAAASTHPKLSCLRLHSPLLSTAHRTDGRDVLIVEETRIAGAEGVPAARWSGDSGGAAVGDARVVPLPGAAGDLFWMRVRPLPPKLLRPRPELRPHPPERPAAMSLAQPWCGDAPVVAAGVLK